MFTLTCAWTNGWANRDAGDLRRHCAHHDVTVMFFCLWFREASVSRNVDDKSSNISLAESFLGNLCFDCKLTISCHMNWIFYNQIITIIRIRDIIRRHFKVKIFTEINVVWEDISGLKIHYALLSPVCGDVPHDDVIKWKHFPRYWLFVRGIHRSPGRTDTYMHQRNGVSLAQVMACRLSWTKPSSGPFLIVHMQL